MSSNLRKAAERVDYRLTYSATPEPRECHIYGIDGPDLPNAYFGRSGRENSSATGRGAWEDPTHPDPDAPERSHIESWFGSAVREAIHEALEWFWVDGAIFLDPHGRQADLIHTISAEVVQKLLAARSSEATNA